MSNTTDWLLTFKLRLKVLRSLADLQLYDSECQTEGALMLKAFTDYASGIRGTEIDFKIATLTYKTLVFWPSGVPS